ncbi:ferric reductase-like transmembrane domain-containing protein [Salipiger sp. P9]|uniref:ferredoxin reductase family protein n=1 Tax=Salipiger pentaromativorans TaxID=2943193 RepID=UPI002157820E|nr:ferric reductase-like transmembrane domain-containing protein [Salipiger pentaromativorans]MCR8548015.1 ferric reductase-like transmembrane domain-containing protein [Salipiger pentaromativorans]
MTDLPRRRGLPPLILALLYTGAVLLPLAFAAAAGEAHRHVTMQFAAATGTVAAGMILLQMISSGRFEAVSGRIGIDITMAFHKWAAPVALAFALAHVAFLIGLPDPERPYRVTRRLLFYATSDTLWDARFALLLLVLLVVLALLRDRLPARYQIWRASHALGAVALVALLVWHILGDGRMGPAGTALWIGFALAVTLPALWVYVKRLTRPARDCWTVAGVRKLTPRIWELTLDNPQGHRLRFRPGQFVWASVGGRRLPLHDHPFSIASAPHDPQLRLLIQEVGDFTSSLGSVTPGTRVGIDGPHGSFGPSGKPRGGLVLIAGGVGIAPALSILTDLAHRGSACPVRFAYSAHDTKDMIPQEMLRPALEALNVTPLLMASTGTGDGVAQGRLGKAQMQRLLDGLDPAQTEVLICGPGPLMTSLTDLLAGMGVPLSQIDYERFSYGSGALSRKDKRMLGGFTLLFAALSAAIAAYSLT